MKFPKWITLRDTEPGEGEFATEAKARADAAKGSKENSQRVYLCRVVAVYEPKSTIEITELKP